MPFGPLLEEVMYVQTKDGRVTCKRCGKSWHFMSETPHRRCIYCHKALYPAPRIKGRCHPICKKGTCFLELIDFLITRQTWWATPGKKGIVWKLAEAIPTTTHDLMLHFQRTKDDLRWFFGDALNRGRVVRKQKWTPMPPEIAKLKVKGRKYTSRRPSQYQYFPTHWAMIEFLARNPDAVEKINGEVPLWRPMRIQRERTLVKFTPIILPRTPQQKRAIYEKRLATMARYDRQMGYPRPTLPQSGL